LWWVAIRWRDDDYFRTGLQKSKSTHRIGLCWIRIRPVGLSSFSLWHYYNIVASFVIKLQKWIRLVDNKMLRCPYCRRWLWCVTISTYQSWLLCMLPIPNLTKMTIFLPIDSSHQPWWCYDFGGVMKLINKSNKPWLSLVDFFRLSLSHRIRRASSGYKFVGWHIVQV
jgi:hypothetical protein